MRQITLKPVELRFPTADGSVPVGIIDGEPLWYIGRTPHAGDVPLTHADIAQELLDAVDEALSPLFGGDWPHPFHVVAGVGARAVQRDRIIKNGLPAAVLHFIGHVSAMGSKVAPPRAFGDVLLAAARMMIVRQGGMRVLRLHEQQVPLIDDGIKAMMEGAVSVVGHLWLGKTSSFLPFSET